MNTVRLILAAVIVAAAFAGAVYIHQHESVVGTSPPTDVDIFARPAVYGRSSWQDPTAVVIAIAGVAAAAALLTARRH